MIAKREAPRSVIAKREAPRSVITDRWAHGAMAALLAFSALVLAAAAVPTQPAAHPAPTPAPVAQNPLLQARSFAYQLSGLRPEQLAHSPFDVLVVDYSRDGSEEHRLTRAEVEAMQRRPGLPGRPRRVLCYLSIGEAETYRYYWDRGWTSTRAGSGTAPPWLGPANPRWRNNHKVRYWYPAWQAIVMGYLDKIIDAGFDGVYLDIIDAYEYWGEGGESGTDRAGAPREMVDFVKKIARHAQDRRPGFAVVPQNGEGLSRFPDYVAAVSAIAKEDLFFDGNKQQPPSDTREALRHLAVFHDAGKPVFVVDYVTRAPLIEKLYQQARALSYIPYATVRELDVLTHNGGFDP